MQKWCLLLFFWVAVLSLQAQVGHGGQPYLKLDSSAENARFLKAVSSKERITFTPPTEEEIRFNIENQRKGRPLTFAYPHLVSLTPENSGVTDVLDDGRLIWQLTLNSPGAYSLNLIFDEFRMADGDSLFIYDASGGYVLGAFTKETNKKWGGLATAPVPGDEIVVEWRGQKLGKEAGGSVIEINAVNHDFLNVFRMMKSAGDFGGSGDCHTDFTCFDDAAIVANGKSTGEIIVNGTEYCTGTLMNNSNNDGTPYVLTAAHCLGLSVESENVVFIMNYEVPACKANIQGSQLQSLSGSQLTAFADRLDFALLEMTETPPDYYRARYSGWDLTENPDQGVHTVHHPNGDVKTVALADDPPVKTSFGASSYLGNTFLSDSHWKVALWNEGSTEGGSSGAGLFLDNGHLIGHLSGGTASCGNPVNDYFARLNKMWDYYPQDTARLDLWLNPSGDGRTQLDSYDPNDGAILRMTHFTNDMTPRIEEVDGGTGVWTGTNSEGVVAVAERFEGVASSKIYGVFLIPGINYPSGELNMKIKVWSGINEPAFLLGEKTVFFNDTVNNVVDKEILVMFDQPLVTSGPFFVGYTLDYTSTVDRWAVYQAEVLDNHNTLMLKTATGWHEFDTLSGGVPSVGWIDVLVGDIVFTDSTSTQLPSDNFRVLPNPVVQDATIVYQEDGVGTITIFNLNGQPVYTDRVLIFNNQALLSGLGNKLPMGAYLVQLEVDGKKVVRKIMVE